MVPTRVGKRTSSLYTYRCRSVWASTLIYLSDYKEYIYTIIERASSLCRTMRLLAHFNACTVDKRSFDS